MIKVKLQDILDSALEDNEQCEKLYTVTKATVSGKTVITITIEKK